jgi:hypothetical protein
MEFSKSQDSTQLFGSSMCHSPAVRELSALSSNFLKPDNKPDK